MAAQISLQFSNRNPVGGFTISGDNEHLSPAHPIPRLIPEAKLKELKGFNLSKLRDGAKLIHNYSQYYVQKLSYFFAYLYESDYLRKVQEGQWKKPDFVCSGGLLGDILLTPLNKKKWDFFAAKLGESIFLWYEPYDKKPGIVGKSTLHPGAIFGPAFEHVVSEKGGVRQGQPVNEFYKTYSFQEVGFGNHQLLLLVEVDCADEKGDLVECKVWLNNDSAPHALKGKYLTAWSQSEACGVKQVVVGTRNHFGQLLAVEQLSDQDIMTRAGMTSFEKSITLEFQHRLMDKTPIAGKGNWGCDENFCRSGIYSH